MSQPPEPTGQYGYGAMPPPPSEAYAGGPTPAVVTPPQLQRAVQCLYGLAVLQVLGFLVSLLGIDAAADTIREGNSTLTDSQVDTAVTIGLVFSAILSLAFAGLWILCGRKMLAGKTWARVVATILTALIVVFDAITLAFGGGVSGARDALSLVIVVVGVILAIAFLVTAWSKPSKSYFAEAQQPR